MKLKMHRIPDELKESAEKDFTKLVSMFKDLAESGVMDLKDIDEESIKGFASFNQSRNSGGLFLYIKGRYMLEVELFGSSSMEEAMDMYQTLNFSKL